MSTSAAAVMGRSIRSGTPRIILGLPATSAEEETGLSAVTIGWIGFGTVVLIAVAVGGVLVARRRGQ